MLCDDWFYQLDARILIGQVACRTCCRPITRQRMHYVTLSRLYTGVSIARMNWAF